MCFLLWFPRLTVLRTGRQPPAAVSDQGFGVTKQRGGGGNGGGGGGYNYYVYRYVDSVSRFGLVVRR